LPDFIDLRDGNGVLDQIAAIEPWSATLAGEEKAERLQALRASANLFALLRAGVSAGRPLSAADDRPGAARVAVLSDGFWRRRFGSDPSALGRQLVLDRESYTVV